MALALTDAVHYLTGHDHLRVWLPPPRNAAAPRSDDGPLRAHRIPERYQRVSYAVCGAGPRNECMYCPAATDSRKSTAEDVWLLPAYDHDAASETVLLLDADQYQRLTGLPCAAATDGHCRDVETMLLCRASVGPELVLRPFVPHAPAPLAPSEALIDRLSRLDCLWRRALSTDWPDLCLRSW